MPLRQATYLPLRTVGHIRKSVRLGQHNKVELLIQSIGGRRNETGKLAFRSSLACPATSLRLKQSLAARERFGSVRIEQVGVLFAMPRGPLNRLSHARPRILPYAPGESARFICCRRRPHVRVGWVLLSARAARDPAPLPKHGVRLAAA